MKQTAAIVAILSLVPALCLLVWTGLHFSKRHIMRKSAMSKAYYSRAREGIPNTTNVELGPLDPNRYTVQLAPYRYQKKKMDTAFVRPTKTQRAQHRSMKVQGTDYHVLRRGPISHKSGSIQRNRRSDNGSNRPQLTAKQLKKQMKKQKHKEKQKGNQNQNQNQQKKKKGKGKHNNHHEERNDDNQQDNWDNQKDNWENHSNQVSNAWHQSQGGSRQDRQSIRTDDIGQANDNAWNENPQEETNQDDMNAWNQPTQDAPPPSQDGWNHPHSQKW